MEDLFFALKTWMPIVKDAVITGAAVIAGYVGLKGLGTWRRQLKGNTNMNTRSPCSRRFIELREAITRIQIPVHDLFTGTGYAR